MVRASDLVALWRWGVLTVPVIYNAGTAWLYAPACYDHQNVPFIISVSETVEEELRGPDCPKPVVTLRHALQKAFDPRQMRRRRAAIWQNVGPVLVEDLIKYCRDRLADVKCPRSVDFVEELPRLPTGKLQKKLIRAPYWAGRSSQLA